MEKQPRHIAMIAGIQKSDRGIGYQGDLLYKIPADQKFFRDTTMGHPVIMGRTTWESIPTKFRPLPGRTNIVITRQEDYTADEALVAHSLEDAIEQAEQSEGADEIFIIGGAQIYEQALPLADTLYLTLFEGNKPADTFFPDYKDFEEIEKSETMIDEKSGVKFWFVRYKRT